LTNHHTGKGIESCCAVYSKIMLGLLQGHHVLPCL